MSAQRIAALEAQVAEMAARLEINDLEAEYACTWDAADAEGWAAVFVDDGVFEMARVGDQPLASHQGTVALTEFCRQVSTFYRGLHFMHLPRLRVQGDVAYGRLHFEWIGLFNPSDQYSGRRRSVGYYDVTYRRGVAGWRIAHRLEKQVASDISEGYDLYVDAAPPGRRN